MNNPHSKENITKDRSKRRIVIRYPPDFDGQLHIEATPSSEDTLLPWVKFEFTHAQLHDTKENGYKPTETVWETLVRAAEGIIAQDKRKRMSPITLAVMDQQKKEVK